MQTLHFHARAAAPRHLGDGRDRSGVVGCELRIDHVVVADQRGGRREIGHVGVRLLGEYRVAGQPHLLRALDLAIPVGTFDESHHEAQARVSSDSRDLVDDLDRARLVGLHG